MGYAIIRMAKIKHASKMRRSVDHAFRTRDTPNADASRTPENTHIGASSAAEALQRFNEALPDKVRKNAVLAVEFLVTASPEAMQGKTREQQDAYFADAMDWLKAKHGAENVVYAGIHRDETTPHMYAYVVPKDERGKLNCRAFYGARDALSTMQSDFAEQVGVKHGLERGLEGSRARHTSIRDYYGRVNAEMPAKTPQIDLPATKLLEGKEAYGERVAAAVLDQMAPELKILRAKAGERDTAVRQQREAERIAKKAADSEAKQRAVFADLADRSTKLREIVEMFTESEIKQAIRRKLLQEERLAPSAKEPERAPERRAHQKGRDLER